MAGRKDPRLSSGEALRNLDSMLLAVAPNRCHDVAVVSTGWYHERLERGGGGGGGEQQKGDEEKNDAWHFLGNAVIDGVSGVGAGVGTGRRRGRPVRVVATKGRYKKSVEDE